MTLEPWYWFVLGILLMLLELVFTTFAAFWFGIAAIMVCILFWIFPWMSTTSQLIMWSFFSIACTTFWFKYIKPLAKKNTPKTRQKAIGQVGMVVETHLSQNKIKVRFSIPVLGQDEWLCNIHQNINVGDRVQITDIQDQEMIIKPYEFKE